MGDGQHKADVYGSVSIYVGGSNLGRHEIFVNIF